MIICTVPLCILNAPYAYSQSDGSQGRQILERAVAATGGREAIKLAVDFRATGSFSLYSGAEVTETGSAELTGSGLKRFRLTATLENETRTWVWKDGEGFLAAKNQHADTIGRHNLTSLEGITFPVFKIIALLDGHSSSVELVESSIVDGRDATFNWKSWQFRDFGNCLGTCVPSPAKTKLSLIHPPICVSAMVELRAISASSV